jgi:tRNA nucleotidyltransferase/poly(A) polymerase
MEEKGEAPQSYPAQIPIPKDIYILMDALKQGDPKVEMYVVGGVVRDYLLRQYHGFPFDPNDYDLTCNLPGKEIARRMGTSYAKQLGISFAEKNNQDTFGVVFVFLNKVQYEIAPFRIDKGSVDGRRPEDTMAGTMYDDAMRRDLTINSLFYDIGNKRIIDFNHGVEDIQNKVIKAVGEPEKRMAEDRLRVLRVARYYGYLGSGATIDPATAEATRKYSPLRNSMGHLLPITSERIEDEFTKGVKKAQDKPDYLHMMHDLGLLEVVFPPPAKVDLQGIDRLRGVSSPNVVMAWLLRGNGPQTQAILGRFRFDGPICKRVQYLVDCLDFGPENVFDLGYKRKKDLPGIEQEMEELARVANNPRLAHLARYQPVFPGGRELMQQGHEGPEIGNQQVQHAADHYTKNYQEPPLTPEP